MAPGFPLYIDLNGNNCTVFGGGRAAAARVATLLEFGAKVTVISPTICDELRRLDEESESAIFPAVITGETAAPAISVLRRPITIR